MEISDEEDEKEFDRIERAMIWDDGEAAASHLRAGRHIYYCCDKYPTEVVRKFPDGRRELVTVDTFGDIVNVRTIEDTAP